MSEIQISSGNGAEPSFPLNQESSSTPRKEIDDSLNKTSVSPSINSEPTNQKPVLDSPKNRISIRKYSEVIHTSKSDFDNQLLNSKRVEQEINSKMSMATANQTAYLLDLVESRDQQIEIVEQETNESINQIQGFYDALYEIALQEKELIDQMNAGNLEERKQCERVIAAYSTYQNELKDAGAIQGKAGQYSLPSDANQAMIDKTNQATQNYQAKVNEFNGYWKSRLQDINGFNEKIAVYNQQFTEISQKLNELLAPYSLSNNVPTFSIYFYDVSAFPDHISAPTKITSAPMTFETFPPPDFVEDISRKGAPLIPQISYERQDAQIFYSTIYSAIYSQKVSLIDEKIRSNTLFWSFVRASESVESDPINDSFLSMQPLFKKILVPLLSNQQQKIEDIQDKKKIEVHEAVKKSALDILQINHLELKSILGFEIIKQIISSQLDKTQVQTHQVDTLVDRFMVLALGMIARQSIESIFSAFEPVMSQVSSLPKDSPIFALLFSFSLLNHMQELSMEEGSEQAVEFLLKDLPGINLLSREIKKLVAALHVGLLLVTSKLVEMNLGLPGLIAQLAISVVPEVGLEKEVRKISENNERLQNDLMVAIEQHFSVEKYPFEETQFLSKVGTDLMERGFIFPSMTQFALKLIDLPLLIDTAAAGLILAHYPLYNAKQIAREAIQLSIDTIPTSINQFRTQLASFLQDKGVKPQVAKNTSLEAILTFTPEKKLIFSNYQNSSHLRSNENLEIKTVLPIDQNSQFSEQLPLSSLQKITSIPARDEKEKILESTLSSGEKQEIPLAESKNSLLNQNFAPNLLERENLPHSREERISSSQTFQNDSTERQVNTSLSDTVLPTAWPLLPTHLASIVKDRALLLLTPALGDKLAYQMTEQIEKVLFGEFPFKDANEDLSRYSFVQVLKNQLFQMQKEDGRQYHNALVDTFKGLFENTLNFSVFAQKIHDPANLFIYSIHTGLMYSGNEPSNWKKSIDIPI